MAANLVPTELDMAAPAPGTAVLRWKSKASSIAEIEQEIANAWARPLNGSMDLAGGASAPHMAARTSVMNLVVIARTVEVASHSSATIQALTGRHPSRTLVVSPSDPDGPSWLDAHIQGHCVVSGGDSPDVCAETIYLRAGGESGRHLDAIVAPLLIHDLPVTVWWPDETPFGSRLAEGLFEMADRLVVDGSTWHGGGLRRLRDMAALASRHPVIIADFALVRQARWREAIASIFDMPDFLPYLRSIRRLAVSFGTRDEAWDPSTTNVVKPLYHVAWLASRLGMRVDKPLSIATGDDDRPLGFSATLRNGSFHVPVVMRPTLSETPAGTTLGLELVAIRRGSELRAHVTAEQDSVHVRAWRDGSHCLERGFTARRLNQIDLLAEALESTGHDHVAEQTLRFAAELAADAEAWA
jgi:glucose-6-phosphate dehydrogenase assembly protein OpcA